MPKKRSPKMDIINALLEHKEATWAQLLHATELSKGALSKHLNDLIKYNRVKVDVNASTRPRKMKYSLVQVPGSDVKKSYLSIRELMEIKELVEGLDLEDLSRILTAFSTQTGYLISKMPNRNQAKELLNQYLAFNLDMLGAYISLIIVTAFAFSRGAVKGGLSPKKQYKQFIKRLREHGIKEFVVPWMESLANTAFWNRDISVDPEKGVYGSYFLEKAQKADLSFFDKIEELQKSSLS